MVSYRQWQVQGGFCVLIYLGFSLLGFIVGVGGTAWFAVSAIHKINEQHKNTVCRVLKMGGLKK